MARTIERADRLEAQLAEMASAGPLKRLYVMVEDFDPEIVRQRLDDYEPVAPLTFEAFVAARVTAIAAFTAIHLVA